MNVEKTNAIHNPNSALTQMADAAAEAVRQVDRLVLELRATVENAATEAESFDQTERSVLASVLQIGFQAMELFVSL